MELNMKKRLPKVSKHHTVAGTVLVFAFFAITAGGSGQYKITVSNAGPSNSTGTTTVNESFPTGIIAYAVNAGSTPGWTCVGAAPNAVCTNSNSIVSGANSMLPSV